MIALALAALVPPGPALRLGPPGPDGTTVVFALDRQGRIATRIACLPSAWADPRDVAAALIASRAVMADVIGADGRLTSIDQLDRSRFNCILLAPEANAVGP